MRQPYPTDLTDDQWDAIRGLIPPPRYGRRPPADAREAVNTLLYQNRTGCRWDMLPHDLLPEAALRDDFARWRDDGTLGEILRALRRLDRAEARRDLIPAIVCGAALSNCGPRVADSDVDAFEGRIGAPLPVGYRRFLLEVNGGEAPADESGSPPDAYLSLHWLGGPISDADVASSFADPMGWSELAYDRDLELRARTLWRGGLSRRWLLVGTVQHEDMLLLRLDDGSVWLMDGLRDDLGEDDCTRVAGLFDELDLARAGP
jgi:transposase